jgi:S-adenosylmethionine:tRNA ribosyltransferase-isomerase
MTRAPAVPSAQPSAVSLISSVGPLGFDFVLPVGLEAGTPAELRGSGRDDVRLMVGWRSTGRIEHHRFIDLVGLLDPGDVLVVNASATLPAAVPATGPHGEELVAHFSAPGPTPDTWWIELRLPAGVGTTRCLDGDAGWLVPLPGGASVELLLTSSPARRLWLARTRLARPVEEYLALHGGPIRYSYASSAWPLDRYQTVFATEPGSAEMPSAARPLTPGLVAALVAKGIDVAPLVLHTGVSSPEVGEPPYAERYRVPLGTADRVNSARRRGSQVIAVGTTAVRALESAADTTGVVHPASGWTELVVGPDRPVRVVDGLLTGWHEPKTTHLWMLEAIAGRCLLERCYDEALKSGYLWHEFGDSHLVLR